MVKTVHKMVTKINEIVFKTVEMFIVIIVMLLNRYDQNNRQDADQKGLDGHWVG